MIEVGGYYAGAAALIGFGFLMGSVTVACCWCASIIIARKAANRANPEASATFKTQLRELRNTIDRELSSL